MIIKVIFLKWMLDVRRDYMIYTVIYRSYQKEWKSISVKKLVCNLFNKKKYVIHVNSLKQALNHRLKLKKITRIIEYIKTEWLKTYIDMNTELRKEAKNDLEKDLFKLMNNSVFKKSMENIRNHKDIRLVTADKKKK